MRVLLFVNNWVGWRASAWMRQRGDNIVGLVVHPPERRKYYEEIIQSTAVDPSCVFDGSRLRETETLERLRALRPDLGVSIFFGYILTRECLDIFPKGCVNIHPAYLPWNRGADPSIWSIVEGTPAGATVHYLDEGVDTGDIIAQKKISISTEDTRESLLRNLEEIGRDLLLDTVPLWVKRTIVATLQDNALATLCQLIEREDGHIIWTDEAENIYNRYRALSPWPGIFSFWKKDDGLLRLKLHHITYQKHSPQIHHPVGQVFEVGEKIGVQTGSGVVFLEEVQLEGKTRMPIAEFLLGNKDIIGSFLQ